MKKGMKIVVTSLLMLFVVFMMFQIVSEAADSGYSQKMGTLLTESESYTDPTNTVSKVNTITGTIITSIRIIGVAVAIVMLLTVAMKYMTAAPGEKADIKKSAIQYVVGAIVLFGVVGILGIINQFSTAVK